jgi:Family of unknown function (DUF6428)
MKLSEFKQHLSTLNEVTFILPDGNAVPKHVHLTEVGEVSKKFMDCGGAIRFENRVSMQLWESVDFWHRLEPSKLQTIIDLSEQKLNIGNYEIEVEYQSNTISKYNLQFEDGQFKLTPTATACLAAEQCGVPSLQAVKEKVESCCTPGGGCC